MKKNKCFNKLTAIVFLVVFAFSACSNDILDKNEVSAGDKMAAIGISVGLKSYEEVDSAIIENSRTVKAKKNSNTSTLSEIKLYAKKTSTDTSNIEFDLSKNLLAKWNSCEEIEKSQYSTVMAAGVYDFMLTAKNYGATMAQTLSKVSLTDGKQTTLNFTSLSASPEGEQTGGIELSLKTYSKDEKLEKFVKSDSAPYPKVSISLDSELVVEKDSDSSSFSGTDENGNSCEIRSSSIDLYYQAAPAGFHIVTITFTAPDSSVFVYTVPVFVQAGYLSSGSLVIFDYQSGSVQNAENKTFVVTYNSNTAEESVKTQTFYTSSSIVEGEMLGFTGEGAKRVKSWNTKKDGSGTSYLPGDTPVLSENITLYAQWGEFFKVTYLVNRNNSFDSFVQRFETGDKLLSESGLFTDFDSSSLCFCGWDTKADGTGIRYVKDESPSLSEDLTLYAQWCYAKNTYSTSKYYECYQIKTAADWNALMGAPFANETEGIIEANLYFSEYKTSTVKPAIFLTKDKKFKGKILFNGKLNISGISDVLFDEISEDSEISNVNFDGRICNKNSGTIKNCTFSNCTIIGTGDYVGTICNINTGTIENCIVESCEINGNKNSVLYTGGICGYNEGIIAGDSTQVSGTIWGKTSGKSYAGGYCGYNKGKITGKGSVGVEVEGSSDEEGHYGYVVGLNAENAVNASSVQNPIDDICMDGVEGTVHVDVANDSLSNGSVRYYQFTLEKTSKVCFSLKDSSGGSNTNKETLSLCGEDKKVIKEIVSGTPSVDMYLYLEKGTYHIYRGNGNFSYTSYMDIKITAY